MPLLRATAESLSVEQMEKGIIEEIINRDEVFAMIPFENVNSKSYVYNREATIAGGTFMAVNSDLEESASTYEQITTTLKILAGQVDVDKFLQTTMSNTNDQVAIQLASKAKGMGNQFKAAMFAGDSAVDANTFDGIAKLVDSSQVLSAGVNGNALSLSALDELKDACWLGMPDAYLMRRGTYRAYKALLRATGGAQPQMFMIENFGHVPSHDGVPILVSDFLPANVTQGSTANTTSVYAARFNEVDGLHGIVGGGQAGFQLEDIGTLQGRDAYRYRLKWYVSLVLKSTKSLAALKGVTNV